MACNYLSDLSQTIWDQLGQPTSISIAYIQSRLVSNAYLGQLNTLTQICHSGVSGYIAPELGPDEQSIYAAMYVRDYFTSKLNQVMNGYDTSFTRITEGDSTIVKSSVAEMAKVYKDAQRESNSQLQYLVAAYRTNPMQARSVEFVSYAPPSAVYPST